MKRVLLFILFTVFYILVSGRRTVSAKTITLTEPNGTQIIYTLSGDEVYEILFNEEEELKIIGQHELSRAIFTYQTVGFVFTMEQTGGKVSEFINSGGRAFQIRFDDVTQKYVNDKAENGVTISTYTFPSDIMQKLFDFFGIDESDEQSYHIYINNVFRLIEYPEGRGNPFIYSDDKTHYDRDSIVAAREWTAITKEKLSHYYDMRISLKRNRGILKPRADEPPQIVESLPEKDMTAEAGFRSEHFLCEEAIPGGEMVEAYATVNKYRLNWKFRRVNGTRDYTVTVEKTYRAVKDEQEDVVLKEHVNVSRSYSYWVIDDFDMLEIDRVRLTNEALVDGEVILSSGNGIGSIYCDRSTSIWNHISDPETYLVLPEGELTEEGTVPEEDIRNAAYGIDSICVRNDSLIVSGVTIMDGSMYYCSAPAPREETLWQWRNQKQFINQKSLTLKEVIQNRAYETNGMTVYRNCFSLVNAVPERSYSLTGLAPISIHTPVVCSPKIVCDNKSYVQLAEPNHEAIPLVLDRKSELNDFILSVSNNGMHRNQKGYGERDYGKTDGLVCYLEKINGKLRNEVRFPFDVMVDVANDNKSDNDIRVEQWTWYLVGNDEQRFYLQEHVSEGTYTAEIRSVAANAGTNISAERTANLNRENYIAKVQVIFQISGRLYGMSINNISGKDWYGVFQNGFQYYSGNKDAYGMPVMEKRYLLPLIDGSHPEISNKGSLAAGSIVDYHLFTTGTIPNTGQIEINLRFFTDDGNCGQEVDLYYTGITTDGKTYLKRLDKVIQPKRISESGNYLQRWEGTFIYPLKTFAVPRGTPVLQIAGDNGMDRVMENAVHNADIMTYFDIVLKSRGDTVLSYENQLNASMGYNNMWRMEGALQEKTDFYGKKHVFTYGAVFLLSTKHSLAEQSNIKLLY